MDLAGTYWTACDIFSVSGYNHAQAVQHVRTQTLFFTGRSGRSEVRRGSRIIDFLDSANNAFEVKTGRQALTSATRRQIAWDRQAVANGSIASATWHFFPNQAGQIQISKSLWGALNGAGINIVVHFSVDECTWCTPNAMSWRDYGGRGGGGSGGGSW